jgi:hypothetical protein
MNSIFYLLFLVLFSLLNLADSNGSLDEILSNRNLKFIFFSGKGGVGKTTVSSSFAIELATRSTGKILLISTDPAHSLSDAFLIPFSSVPTNVPGVDNLFVMEINPQSQLEKEIKVCLFIIIFQSINGQASFHYSLNFII